MKRTALWLCLLASIWQLSASRAHSQAQGRLAKPNILFCFADDWGRYASVYAALEKQPSLNQVVKTPNIDRVAREGVLFRRAFVNAPSCTPCRSALLSGRYFFNTGRGAILHAAVWDDAIPSFPFLLRDVGGYHIGETYKVWSPGTPVDAPFGAGKHAYEKAGNLPNNFSENATEMLSKGSTLAAAREKIYGQVRANFDAFLADRKAGQPWLYWFGPTTTHRRWTKGSGKALWGIEPDALKGKLPPFLPDVPEVREDVADYLGEAQAYDAYIGVLLKRLEETGELDNTLIVISGDHGMPGVTNGKCNLYDFGTGVTLAMRLPKSMKGKVGRVVDDFVSLPDLAPTFLDVAGVPLPKGMNARSLLNVLRSPKSGQVDASRAWVISGRERHVAFARDNDLPYPQRALRTNDFLYIRNFKPERWPLGGPVQVTETKMPTMDELESNTYVAFPDMDASPTKAWLVAHRNEPQWKRFYDFAFAKRPGEELYDLRKDPHQINNVAAEPAYAKARAQLAAQLLKILTEAGDPRVTGDGLTFERPPYTDPAPASQR
ncbi:MAG: sulfatase [Acidobacteria bacterium]|nr:sulfatase [Acidobacteriota bacterium]MBI3424223.1 sulfatase [Acidobacteriota bacterium]